MEGLPIIASYLQHQDHLDREAWTQLFVLFVEAWRLTLAQPLPWGPMPHYGYLGGGGGGVSGFQMEAIYDLLDYVMAETGRSYWTDLAWQRIARLGMVQRRCPDCGQWGAQGKMALYGPYMPVTCARRFSGVEPCTSRAGLTLP